MLLGIVAALVAVLFVKTLYKTEDLCDEIKVVPEWLKPVFGGLIIGAIGMKFPQILGVGYETIEAAFRSEILLGTLLALVLVKLLATSITLGAGFSVGVFAPSLFLGATLGGAFGLIINNLFPAIAGNLGAYAIVGMGAVVAGTTQAPITAVLIIFEMTRDYHIILPLMIAVVFCTFIFSYFSDGSIYTLKLLRRGVNLEEGKDINIMKRIRVGDIMTDTVATVKPDDKLDKVIEMMHNTKHNGFPVIDERNELQGIITLEDIRETPVKGIMDVPVNKVMSTKLVVTNPEEVIDTVFRRLRKHDLGHLPVVSPDDPKKLVGIVTRSDLLKAYDRELVNK